MKSKSSVTNATARKRVVVDTSILISATLTDGTYRKLIRKLLARDFELCIPQAVIDEYEEYIQHDKFKKYQPLFTEIFEELRKSSVILPSASTHKYVLKNSPEDEEIINCCTENQIRYLITIDKKTIGKFNGLEVIFAQEFYCQYLLD